MKTRREIDLLGQQLLRSPELREPMRDALEDLGVTWAQWLTQTETVERLAECMLLALGADTTKDPVRWTNHFIWQRAIHLGSGKHLTSARYLTVASAFGVPPLFLEIGRAAVSAPNLDQTLHKRWRPPSAELAMIVLQQAVDLGEYASRMTTDEREAATTSQRVHRESSILMEYRIRIGKESWTERPLPYEDLHL